MTLTRLQKLLGRFFSYFEFFANFFWIIFRVDFGLFCLGFYGVFGDFLVGFLVRLAK
jgi:hypothetical protein